MFGKAVFYFLNTNIDGAFEISSPLDELTNKISGSVLKRCCRKSHESHKNESNVEKKNKTIRIYFGMDIN